MIIIDKEFEIRTKDNKDNLIDYFRSEIFNKLHNGEFPIRFVVTKSSEDNYLCELGLMSGLSDEHINLTKSVFDFRKRDYQNTNEFNTVFLVPTGIGAKIGGHAGDACPTVKLLASVSDTLITHPNAVNASDINEIPENALYVEGSIICRLIMGTISLQKVRYNRVLAVIDKHNDESFFNAAVNSVNAAHASCGFKYTEIVKLDPPINLSSIYTHSGRASGKVESIDALIKTLQSKKGQFDAVSLSSIIGIPLDYHMDYYTSRGNMVNPWGGVEALLTHTISTLFDIPAAHSPMLESDMTANIDPGIVEPRMAAETVSTTFMHCVLKGLHKSPKIISDPNLINSTDLLSAKDISCLVIPDGCMGLPTLAALEQGITTIAVTENTNIMNNDLRQLPWEKEKFYIVKNYLEAAGIISAIKAGVSPDSVRRPIREIEINDSVKIDKSAVQMRKMNIKQQ